MAQDRMQYHNSSQRHSETLMCAQPCMNFLIFRNIFFIGTQQLFRASRLSVIFFLNSSRKYCLTYYKKPLISPKIIWKRSSVCSIYLSIVLTGETDTVICRIWNIPWWPDVSHTWRTFFSTLYFSPITHNLKYNLYYWSGILNVPLASAKFEISSSSAV